MTDKKLLCQECCGHGEVLEEIILGHRRYAQCGWCQGSGYVSPTIRGVWLREQREIKKTARLTSTTNLL